LKFELDAPDDAEPYFPEDEVYNATYLGGGIAALNITRLEDLVVQVCPGPGHRWCMMHLRTRRFAGNRTAIEHVAPLTLSILFFFLPRTCRRKPPLQRLESAFKTTAL
jgi:hypothetical protein